MEPTACRERLARLIDDECAALDALAALLAREHEHLASNDAAALDETLRERQRCIARVVRADDARRALCRELGHTPDRAGLERILRWCDPQGTLAAGWARWAVAAERCRALNDGNSALVSARLQHVQARLAALMGGRGEPVTYGRQGAYTADRRGQVVRTEA